MTKEDGNTVFDAKNGCRFDELAIYVYSKNLSDKEYSTDFNSNSSLAMAYINEPSTFGVGVSYQF